MPLLWPDVRLPTTSAEAGPELRVVREGRTRGLVGFRSSACITIGSIMRLSRLYPAAASLRFPPRLWNAGRQRSLRSASRRGVKETYVVSYTTWAEGGARRFFLVACLCVVLVSVRALSTGRASPRRIMLIAGVFSRAPSRGVGD